MVYDRVFIPYRHRTRLEQWIRQPAILTTHDTLYPEASIAFTEFARSPFLRLPKVPSAAYMARLKRLAVEAASNLESGREDWRDKLNKIEETAVKARQEEKALRTTLPHIATGDVQDLEDLVIPPCLQAIIITGRAAGKLPNDKLYKSTGYLRQLGARDTMTVQRFLMGEQPGAGAKGRTGKIAEALMVKKHPLRYIKTCWQVCLPCNQRPWL